MSLRFVVYDAQRVRRGWVMAGSPLHPVLQEAHVVLRHTAQSSAELVVDADHHLVPVLGEHGARVVVEHQRPGAWAQIMSGRVKTRKGSGFPPSRTYTIADDRRILWDLRAWPSPDRPITAQDRVTHWRMTGPAETVAKALIEQNAARYKTPVVIAPDQGRGTTIEVETRFDRLSDVLVDRLDAAGLGISVILAPDGAALHVDVYSKRIQPVPLSDRAGVIVDKDPTFSDSEPTVTRIIVGAGGEGTKRVLSEHIDTARETEWGELVIEDWVDATDLKPGDIVQDPDFRNSWNDWAPAGWVEWRLDPDEGSSIRLTAGPSGEVVQRAWATLKAGDNVAISLKAKRTATAGTIWIDLPGATGTWDTGDNRLILGVADSEWITWENVFHVTADTVSARPAIYASSLNGPVDITDVTYQGGRWVSPHRQQDVADEKLVAGAATAALNTQLAETAHYNWPSAIDLGDIVTASVAGGPLLTDTVSEIRIDLTPDDGFVVVPHVGDRSHDPDHPDAGLAAVVGQANTRIRRLETGR